MTSYELISKLLLADPGGGAQVFIYRYDEEAFRIPINGVYVKRDGEQSELPGVNPLDVIIEVSDEDSTDV